MTLEKKGRETEKESFEKDSLKRKRQGTRKRMKCEFIALKAALSKTV